jgi:hypothetical protein
MKRRHRRWHRWMWSLLLPVLGWLLLAAWWDRDPPPTAAELPAVFNNAPEEGHR